MTFVHLPFYKIRSSDLFASLCFLVGHYLLCYPEVLRAANITVTVIGLDTFVIFLLFFVSGVRFGSFSCKIYVLALRKLVL